MCPSLAAADKRLGGVVGKRAEAQNGVLRAEAQKKLVVNGACGDDDMCVVVGRCPRCVPTVLGEGWKPQGERPRPKYQDPRRGMVVVRVQGGMPYCTAVHTLTPNVVHSIVE